MSASLMWTSPRALTKAEASAFKDCDIRGVYGTEVTDEIALRLGQAIGTLLPGRTVLVAGDLRTSTPALKERLIHGLVRSGAQVFDCGEAPTPAFYFALAHFGVSAGVMVTASHNPPAHNGFKVALSPLPITVEEIAALRSLVEGGVFAGGQGVAHPVQIKAAYVKWLDAAVAPLLAGVTALRVVIDAGNGSYWEIGPGAFRRAGFEVVELFCSPDGRFPSRSPNPAVAENLRALSMTVVEHRADLGIAFDGDGDRVAFVDERGDIIPPDHFLAVMARDVLSRDGAGKVILDIKCSKAVADVVTEGLGGVVLERSGHTFIKRRMLTEDAVFGGELSGHMFYRALGGRDDGLYSALRMAAVVAHSGLPLSELIRTVPTYMTTPDLRIPFHGDRDEVLERIADGLGMDVPISRLDGVRADFEEGWALARASVTEPALTFRFEVFRSGDLELVIDRFLGPVPDLLTAVQESLRDRAGAKRS